MVRHKLTPWFPVSRTPVRSGVYETKIVGEPPRTLPAYSWWDNSKKRWGIQCSRIEYADAARETTEFSLQTKKWRGVKR